MVVFFYKESGENGNKFFSACIVNGNTAGPIPKSNLQILDSPLQGRD